MKPQTGSRGWYQLRAKADDAPAEVFIYDQIGAGFYGGGVPAQQFIEDVKALKLAAKDELLVRINSPGGDVFDGFAIYNYLRSARHRVRVSVDGVAASAASVVAMAGNVVEMPENAMLMIHHPWMMVVGNAEAMRKAARDLEKIGEGVAGAYLTRAGDRLDRDRLTQMLDAETWLTGREAVDLGLADVVNEPVRALACAWREDSLPAAFRRPAVKVDLRAERARLAGLSQSAPSGV